MPTEIRMPDLGENIETADIVKTLVSVGDRVALDQPLLELETNKATLELPSPSAGVVSEILIKEGDECKVGDVVLVLSDEGEPGAATNEQADDAELPDEPSEAADAPVAAATDVPDSIARMIPAAPSVRRLAREAGISLSDVTGSGPDGRVSVDDVRRHGSGMQAPPPSVPGPGIELPNFENWGGVRREKMTNVRRATAEHLAKCWSQIPHVTQFDSADITELEVLRKQHASKATEAGGKLTMAVMVVKVVASALKVFPKFNASVDMAERSIIYKDYINVGIAVATERGLLVPVLRDVDSKNMVEIAVEVSELAKRTRNGDVGVKDLQGGTFTVTNLGNLGGTNFTPIINWPEVAILGMGKAQTQPGFEDGTCKPKLLLPLSLSYDHRVIDGVDGAKFLRWIVDAIEEPLLLSLEG